MTRAERMHTALSTRFAGAAVAIQDDSAQHAGHGGARPGGETHYTVRIISDDFTGLSRVARHRLVNAALQPEFDTGLHALSLILVTPQEA